MRKWWRILDRPPTFAPHPLDILSYHPTPPPHHLPSVLPCLGCCIHTNPLDCASGPPALFQSFLLSSISSLTWTPQKKETVVGAPQLMSFLYLKIIFRGHCAKCIYQPPSHHSRRLCGRLNLQPIPIPVLTPPPPLLLLCHYTTFL